MRREQLGELVNLTSHLPAQPRTAEMPAVELVDLLRRDRELGASTRASTRGNTEHLAPSAGYNLGDFEEEPVPHLAAGTIHISRRSNLKLALGCLAAFASGFALTAPLWW